MMVTPHSLGKQEALNRLKGKLIDVRERYGHHVSEPHATWSDNILSFAFRAGSIPVEGTVTVDESEVRWAAQVPLAVVVFKKAIEKRIRFELGDLLS